MICDEPAPEPEKIICRCKNCVLRPADVLPWPGALGAVPDAGKDGNTSRRVSSRTIQSMDSVYTLRDGNNNQNNPYKDQPGTRPGTATNSPTQYEVPIHGAITPILHESHSPNYHQTNSRVTTQPPPAQPTILLIVVNKNDPPPMPGRGYPDPNPGPGPRYQGQGFGYPGQGPGGYSGPGPRGYPAQSGGPPGYYYPPPRPRRRPENNYGQDRFRYDSRRNSVGFPNNRTGYQDESRVHSRRNSNNVYGDRIRYGRNNEVQRNCRCPTTEKSNPETPTDPEYLNEDPLKTVEKRKSKHRLVGSGNGNSYRTEQEQNEKGRGVAGGAAPYEIENFPETPQEVIVTDAKNKTYKCIQVPICISNGKPDTCRCCKCAPENSDEELIDEDAECLCNQDDKCTCVPDNTFPDELTCECNLTDLERTLRELIPNVECLCFLKSKKRRRRRKKWTPKRHYDRFASPPFVLNPKPRCLEYGCCPYPYPCYNPCCQAPVAKSCYTCDYGCGCCCRC
ncbi:uncharacterized protein CG42266 [Drosophila ficusphila]|uniref:uncharacterized protein CG42266 n=1 Tax=Drosophila ficusphila TaxID=30025 RepID=UPI001C88EAEF|nr:uncharacterized protein CG42266 [Drosophila ficusphila]